MAKIFNYVMRLIQLAYSTLCSTHAYPLIIYKVAHEKYIFSTIHGDNRNLVLKYTIKKTLVKLPANKVGSGVPTHTRKK